MDKQSTGVDAAQVLIRPASYTDHPQVLALLSACALPLEGAGECPARGLVALTGGEELATLCPDSATVMVRAPD